MLLHEETVENVIEGIVAFPQKSGQSTLSYGGREQGRDGQIECYESPI